MDTSNEQRLQELQAQLERLRARVNAAKIAYLNRTPFDEMVEVSYDDLSSVAKEYINASYDYQKLKYGSVKLRISVAKLLRR